MTFIFRSTYRDGGITLAGQTLARGGDFFKLIKVEMITMVSSKNFQFHQSDPPPSNTNINSSITFYLKT
jgi:hypothetical protein